MAIHKRRKRARSFIQASGGSAGTPGKKPPQPGKIPPQPPGKIPVPGPRGPNDYEGMVRKYLDFFGFRSGALHKDLNNFMECANAIAEHYGWWSSFPMKAPLNKIAHHMDNIARICKKRGEQMGGRSASYAFQVACKKARPKKPPQPGGPGMSRPKVGMSRPKRRMGRP